MPTAASPNHLVFLALTRTATHAGCGQGLDDIDLPIQRSQATGLPIFMGSTVKGVLRQHAPDAWGCSTNEVITLFGPDREAASLHAGMLTPQDARLLAMPVASLEGGWGWVTCADALRRFRRDTVPTLGQEVPALPPVQRPGQALVGSGSPLRLPDADHGDLLALQEFTWQASQSESAGTTAARNWALWLAAKAFPHDEDDWRQAFADRLVVVPDDDFVLLSQLATEVRARVSLNSDRTPKENALWREECLPADSLLWGLIGAQAVSVTSCTESIALAFIKPCNVQLGGKASVGYGNLDFLPLRSTSA